MQPGLAAGRQGRAAGHHNTCQHGDARCTDSRDKHALQGPSTPALIRSYVLSIQACETVKLSTTPPYPPPCLLGCVLQGRQRRQQRRSIPPTHAVRCHSHLALQGSRHNQTHTERRQLSCSCRVKDPMHASWHGWLRASDCTETGVADWVRNQTAQLARLISC